MTLKSLLFVLSHIPDDGWQVQCVRSVDGWKMEPRGTLTNRLKPCNSPLWDSITNSEREIYKPEPLKRGGNLRNIEYLVRFVFRQ